MPAHWYVSVDGEEHGPMDPDALRSMAAAGRVDERALVRRGEDGPWLAASRVRGLFLDEAHRRATVPDDAHAHAFRHITTVHECLSPEERKKRAGVTLVNGLSWLMLALFTLLSFGGLAAVWLIGWVISRLTAEYNVRKLTAFGTLATPEQFPEIAQAMDEVCGQFGIDDPPRVIVINAAETNAFAIRFARKKVIVLLSEVLQGVIDHPAELRFLLGHELGHTMLDHGSRGVFELYRPAAYRAARELTCDNTGTAAAGDVEAARTVLRRLAVGNALHTRLNDDYLETEARQLESGLTGWLLRQYMTYPPIGRRIAGVTRFADEHAA